MFRSIFVAIHDSSAAQRALHMSVRIARVSGARLHGLFVEDPSRLFYVPLTSTVSTSVIGEPPFYVPLPPKDLFEEEERIEVEERQILQVFRGACDDEGLQGQFRAIQGRVDETIVRCSRSVDLIVMGFNGSNFGLGNVVEPVLRQSARPVLLVPSTGRVEGPIIFAYDGSHAAQRAMVAGAHLLGFEAFSDVHVVIAGDPGEDRDAAERDAREYLSVYCDNLTIHAIERQSPTQAIRGCIDSSQGGLLVMGAFGNSRFKELLFGSTTRDILETAECLVLMAS